MENSLYHLVQKILIKNKLSINLNELKLQIESHPSYPSLHAITSVLDHFGIDNMALDIPQNEEVYLQLPKYFIAHLKTDKKEELVFVVRENDFVTLTNTNKKKNKITKNEFLKQWSGIVVVIEKEELATNTLVKKKRLLKRIPLLLVASSFIFSLYLSYSFLVFPFSQISLSLVGTYIGYLLIKHELGFNSNIVEKLCTSFEKTNCDAVLNSKIASIFGWFKLSDITFVYFLSLSLIWTVSIFSYIDTYFLGLLSLLTLPVVGFSIYYQAFIIKKWCPLCLATASILTIQTALFHQFQYINFQFEISNFISIVFSFSLVILAYSSIKPLVISNLDLSKSKLEFYKFKRKFSLFKTLYNQNPILDTSIHDIQEIIFGNTNSSIEILVITNPLCDYCKATHQAIEKLLSTNKNDVKITIRFNVNAANKEHSSYKIASTLLKLYQKDAVLCREAMAQIYSKNVAISKWINSYKIDTNHTQHIILNIEKQWCIDNNIHFTPAVYLNRKEFPKEYELSDLSLFIEDFQDEFIETNAKIYS